MEPAQRMTNERVAAALDRAATLLDAQRANPFRVRAYREGARAVRELPRPAAELLDEGGRRALEVRPAIGRAIAAAVDELVHTGRWGLLDRLEGQVSPEDLFTTIPGIGDDLARAVHDHLHLETLEELEAAAHDGRLAGVPGFGPRRVAAVRGYLAGALSRSARRGARTIDAAGDAARAGLPPVDALLDVDAEYRAQAGAGALHTIAPRRFNPGGDAWLPVLHTERDGWHLTAMFSNTARAHRLGKTRDWVIVVSERDGDEHQHTVVTEYRGALAGRRVVRGRETESADYYRRRRLPRRPRLRIELRRIATAAGL